MRVLILGGTVFLGRHLVEAAQRRGHELTLFNRGRSNADLFPEVETLHGDREAGADGLAALQGRQWDAVIDTCGYLPGVVASSARALADAAPAYAFVSSISVLADTSTPKQTEAAPLAQLPDGAAPDEFTLPHYGALKALCEAEVRAIYGEAALIVRPGLIVGPHDPTDRFTYWPRRVAQGGEVLAPPAEQRVQFIDARDLADWILRVLEARVGGTYFGVGPRHSTSMADVLEACRTLNTPTAEFTHLSDEFLLAHEVKPFTELPLWVPASDRGFLDVDLTAALSVGIAYRPLVETIADTLRWDLTRPADTEIRAGLTLEREAQLLAAWHAR
ncbi:MAG: hypothetical protein DHS20C15_04300 [Planctomycetota bacterium]|nr:MAG: hypothetical protein DHS20C15_04300 [Planctomycetota bacterium]